MSAYFICNFFNCYTLFPQNSSPCLKIRIFCEGCPHKLGIAQNSFIYNRFFFFASIRKWGFNLFSVLR